MKTLEILRYFNENMFLNSKDRILKNDVLHSVKFNIVRQKCQMSALF